MVALHSCGEEGVLLEGNEIEKNELRLPRRGKGVSQSTVSEGRVYC